MPSQNLVKPQTLILDGKGGAEFIEGIKECDCTKNRLFWQHLDYHSKDSKKLLINQYEMEQTVISALFDTDTRPRFFIHNEGMVLILRAVNHNKGSAPEDMISIRIWIDEQKIISLGHRELKAIEIIYDLLKDGKGPKNPAQCFLAIADKLAIDILDLADDINEASTDLEEEEIDDLENLQDFELREKLSALRKQIIGMRRYLAPQRDVFLNLQTEKNPIFLASNKSALREISNKMIKAIEDIDYAKDHLSVLHEELQGKMAISMNKIMYIISIFTAIFLPLTLLTGLLGINVKGIPYAESPYAFGLVCLLMVLICFVLISIMKRLRWF